MHKNFLSYLFHIAQSMKTTFSFSLTNFHVDPICSVFLFSLIPVINILGKSIHLNEIAIHNSSDVAVENAKNMIHNLGHLKQDSKPRYSSVYDFSLLFLLIFIF